MLFNFLFVYFTEIKLCQIRYFGGPTKKIPVLEHSNLNIHAGVEQKNYFVVTQNHTKL